MKRALEGIAGVQKVTMRFEDKEFDVEYDAKQVSTDAFVAAVAEAGFEATVR